VLAAAIPSRRLSTVGRRLLSDAYGGDKSTSPNPKADHVVYKDNVFARGSNGKCAAYGAVTGFDVTSTGNQWINNTWEDDHSLVMPEE
jgi:hypothetical protein